MVCSKYRIVNTLYKCDIIIIIIIINYNYCYLLHPSIGEYFPAKAEKREIQ